MNAAYPAIPFSFNYVAPATGGSSSRTEQGDGSGRVTGSYTINDADGRSRVVNYVADAGGFRAQIETNEPGTLTSNAADAIYRSNAPAVVYGAPSSYLGAASNAYNKYGGGAGGFGGAGGYGAGAGGYGAGAGAFGGAGRGHHAW